MTAVASPARPGRVVGRRYRLRRLVGRGGFGAVWEAESADGRCVAVKLLSCRDSNEISQEVRALCLVSRLQHPHLLPIEEVSVWEGGVAIVMPLADDSLLEVLQSVVRERGRGLPRPQVCTYLAQAAKAIDFLNRRQHLVHGDRVGLQHCDIKPENLLRFGDTIRVADFGLSCHTGCSYRRHWGAGTPQYMASEVFQGRLSQWTDQYALAVTYYQLRTGRFPFPDPPAEVSVGYVRPQPDLNGLEPAERPIIARALHPVPQNRWPSCTALLDELTGLTARETRFDLGWDSLGWDSLGRSERRAAPRYLLSRPLRCRVTTLTGAALCTAALLDVSTHGLGLVTERQLEAGAAAAVSIPGLPSPRRARIRHVSRHGHGTWRAGCRLVQPLSPQELARLQREACSTSA